MANALPAPETAPEPLPSHEGGKEVPTPTKERDARMKDIVTERSATFTALSRDLTKRCNELDSVASQICSLLKGSDPTQDCRLMRDVPLMDCNNDSAAVSPVRGQGPVGFHRLLLHSTCVACVHPVLHSGTPLSPRRTSPPPHAAARTKSSYCLPSRGSRWPASCWVSSRQRRTWRTSRSCRA